MTNDATLVFQLYTGRQATPVTGAKVTVTSTDGAISRVVYTGASGRSAPLPLPAPPCQLGLSPDTEPMPYATYNAVIAATGYLAVTVTGLQLWRCVEALQSLELSPAPRGSDPLDGVNIIIPPPAVITDQPRSPDSVPTARQQAFILNSVYIPRFITVHLGRPDNSSAQSVTVTFQDYIKNVASSEIYPTWPDSSLRANIYAQISFALNRIFTEWYPSRGYNFDITSSTSFDQYYVHGRNIFDNISRIVDEIFNEYVRKKGTINPLFTEYCNGTTVTCKGLSQWGTVSLAQNGYSPLNILKRYYGNNIEIIGTDDIRYIEASFPGTSLRLGSSSSAVRTLENQLNRIRRNYPAIPLISSVNNSFTRETEDAVKSFQRIFSLTADGVVGRTTWNKISYIYAAVKGLAELGGEGEDTQLPSDPPSSILRRGDNGAYVRLAQYFLRVIANYYEAVRPIAVDGIFGAATEAAVRDLQTRFGLGLDGIVGPLTWQKLYDVFMGIANTSGLVVGYPGYLLQEGSRGDNVWLMQDYLRTIAGRYPIPSINADGIYGSRTRTAVVAFQRSFGLDPDGIIGKNTWDRIITVRLLL